jgi:hypothetical protein
MIESELPKKKRGRPKGSVKKVKEDGVEEEVDVEEQQQEPPSPVQMIKESTSNQQVMSRKSPRLNALLQRPLTDTPQSFSFAMRTPVLGGWNNSKGQDQHEFGDSLPKSVDFFPRIPSGFLSPIANMPKSANGSTLPMIPPALTPEMSPNFLSGNNLQFSKFQSLRRSPRFTPATRGFGGPSAFSPTVFWRSPVPGTKQGQLPSLDDVPLEMPPAYFSGGFLDPDGGALGFGASSRNPKLGHSPKTSPVRTSEPLLRGRPRKPKTNEELLEKNEFNVSGESNMIDPNSGLPTLPFMNEVDEDAEGNEDASQQYHRYQYDDDGERGGLGSSCHQCKSRRAKNQLAYCNAGMSEGGKKVKIRRPCRKKYCGSCLSKFYHEKMPGAHISWSCPACRQICTCAACRKNKLKSSKYFQQDPALMSPATSIAVGLVYFGDISEEARKFKLDEVSPEVQAKARKAADMIVKKAKETRFLESLPLNSDYAQMDEEDVDDGASFSMLPNLPQLSFTPPSMMFFKNLPAVGAQSTESNFSLSRPSAPTHRPAHADDDDDEDESEASESEAEESSRKGRGKKTSLQILKGRR